VSTTIEPEPILVTKTRAKQLIDVGDTLFTQLVKDGVIKLVRLGAGRRDLVDYRSLKALPEQHAATTPTDRP
jgi:hypothetical protein